MNTPSKILKLVLLLSLLVALWQPSMSTRAQPARHGLAVYQEQVKYFSGEAMLLAAQARGVSQVMGKPVDGQGPPGAARAKKLRDVPIGANPDVQEDEPSIAANPVDQKRLVAGSHAITDTVHCVAYTSSSRGASWSAPHPMAQLTPQSQCSDPVLAYAPDGSRVYYAYMDIKSTAEINGSTITFTDDYDIVVSYSNDNGANWTGPVVALDGDPSSISFNIDTGEIIDIEPGFQYDKPWIGAPIEPGQAGWVYVTSTRFDNDFQTNDCHISFARSGQKGSSGSWSTQALLDSSQGGCANPIVVQFSRPAGGLGGEVLVAWYHSGYDGWLDGSFQIRTRRSANHGSTWSPVVIASQDSYEVPYWLGPNAFYHRWWGVMGPDVEIDPGGAAHIVYTHDPAANPIPGQSDTPEDGDIRYITSNASPYTRWTAPVTVNDDNLIRAQGYAALEVQRGGQSSTVVVIWEDHRLAPDMPIDFPNSPNLYYDIYSARKVPGQNGWFPNQRVSDTSSIVDYVFIGDYNDLAASQGLLFGVWTDRRHQTEIFAYDDNVYGGQFIPGGGAP